MAPLIHNGAFTPLHLTLCYGVGLMGLAIFRR